MTGQNAKQDNPAQSKRFLEIAQEVEAENNLGAFDRAFTAVANTPKDSGSQPKRRTSTKKPSD